MKVEPNHRAGVKLALRNSVQQSGHSRDDGGGDDSVAMMLGWRG